ncbi:MAG: hypothetical protein ACI4JM_06415, partial [Oscillospiraceae bacterium]
MGVWGLAPALQSFQKSFLSNFFQKSLCERSSQNRNNKIPQKTQRATIGRPYKIHTISEIFGEL